MIIVRALFVRRGLELVLIVVCSFLTTTCSTTGRQITNTSPAGIDDKPLRLVRAYIVSVNVPCDAATMVMKSITDSVPLKYGNYDQVAFRSAIGIEQFRDPRDLGLDRMLLQPFRGEAGRYPLGRRELEQ